MSLLLHLETTTQDCSVALSKGDDLLSITSYEGGGYVHSEKLHLFIQETFEKASLAMTAIEAVSVSMGPGSYTGLRVGVATAKGICFALSKPLIAIDTLAVLTRRAEVAGGYIIPVLDARRMEVYTAVFDANYHRLTPTQALVLEQERSFKDYFDSHQPICFVGNASQKCKNLWQGAQLTFQQVCPNAREMVTLAYQKYQQADFEDLAYFEPFYLKDFIVTPPKK